MNRARLSRRFAQAWLCAALLASAPACTLFDDYLPGTPFTPDQPEAEITLQDVIHVDPIRRSTESCPAGGTIIWGYVRNTGDLDVDELEIIIDVFGPSGALLASFRDHVFNGEVVAGEGEGSIDAASTSLAVDQTGTFNICTPLPAALVFRTDYRTEFIIIETGEIQ
jgi:hypothetical protein